jgi:hypothetical protein
VNCEIYIPLRTNVWVGFPMDECLSNFGAISKGIVFLATAQNWPFWILPLYMVVEKVVLRISLVHVHLLLIKMGAFGHPLARLLPQTTKMSASNSNLISCDGFNTWNIGDWVINFPIVPIYFIHFLVLIFF